MSYIKFCNDFSSNFHGLWNRVIARALHHCQKDKELPQ